MLMCTNAARSFLSYRKRIIMRSHPYLFYISLASRGLICLLSMSMNYVSSASAEIRTQDIKDPIYRDGCHYVSTSIKVSVSDWHVLTDDTAVLPVLNRGRDAVLLACANYTPLRLERILVQVVAPNTGRYVAAGTWNKNESRWTTIVNNVSVLIDEENKLIAVKREAEEKKRVEAELSEQQKKSALAYCGAEPAISGGPWFSSTYKVAARDEAKRGFFCVKTIEYVSDAPNPFGGKAARARFRGYRHTYSKTQPYNLVDEVRDFAY